MRAAALLRDFRDLRYDFSTEGAARKRALLDALGTRGLASADDVLALHDELCFLRAYATNPELRDQAGAMLASFERRRDLQRFRRQLLDSGIAGTDLDFRFYWLTAIWLAKQGLARNLTIDWKDFENAGRLSELLPRLLPFSETPLLDSEDFEPQEWIERLKAPKESDAEFVIERFERMRVPTPLREKLYEDLDIPMRLHAGPGVPARGLDEWPAARVVFPTQPPDRGRPDLRKAIHEERFTISRLDPGEASRLIDLANRCMVPRHRDLLIFLYADPKDARYIDFGDGLSFLCVGAVPDRRLVLESVYGFLTLMNGYPIGYVLCSAFLGSAEVAYNVFETFRGRGAARTYARILAMVHRLFGADTFAVDPYQLGHDNDEGLDSGAWWFYYKLGFRPHDAGIKRLVREERAAMRTNPRHRTSRARLNELASEYMYLHLDKPRADVLGRISLGAIGERMSERLAARFGADREGGTRVLAGEVAERLGQKLGKLSKGERIAWDRWAPLVDALPGVARWSPADRKALAKVIRAKGGRSEAKYVALSNAHGKLRRALAKLGG